MTRRITAWAAAAVAASLSLLAGCASSPTSLPKSVAPPSIGNTAIVALPPGAAFNWFFPVVPTTAATVYNTQSIFNRYVPLITVDGHDRLDYRRSLAKSIRVNGTGTVYTITLNSKYRWSNGQPVTSADVVWTAQLLLYSSTTNKELPWENQGAGSGGIPTRVQSIKAQGPYQVVVTLNRPSNPQWFIRNGLGQIVPAPKSVWDIHRNWINEMKFIQSVGNTPQSPYYRVVDGPFRYDAADSKPNQYWAFVPNPHFDGQRASIKKVVYEYFTSSTAEFAALKKGTVNVGVLPFHLLKDRGLLTGDRFSAAYPFAFDFFVLNMSDQAPGGIGPIFRQLYVRQALQMGVDQKGMIKAFDNGLGVPTLGPVPAKPLTPFFDSALKNPYPYNPEAGTKLLEDHGWTMKNGVLTKNGHPLHFTLFYATGFTSIEDEVQLLKADYAKEGIDVTLQGQPAAFHSQQDAAKWQAVFWGGWTYEPDYYPTGGVLFASHAGENFGGYSSRRMDQLIAQTYEPGTPSQIRAWMDAYQEYAAKELPVIYMPVPEMYFETADYVHGVAKYYNPIVNVNWPNSWTITH